MPVDYAEPQKLADFKIDVLPANSNTPIATKQPGSNIFTPTTPGDIVRYNSRNSDLGRPSNLPPVQSNLRNDGQYRTINLVPKSRNDGSIPSYAPPSRRTADQMQTIRNNGTAGLRTSGLSVGQNYARDQAAAEAAYYTGFFLSGLFDGLSQKYRPNPTTGYRRTGLEDLAYNAGTGAGNEARNIVKDARDALKRSRDDLWKNRPHFEIPQIKLPDFKFPEIELPKIPEFKFPEISFPKPKPIPPPKPASPQPKQTLRDRLKDVDVSSCGSIEMTVAYASRVTGHKEILDDEGYLIATEKIFVQTSVSSVTGLLRKYNPYLADKSDAQIIGYGADGYGGGQKITNSEGYFETSVFAYTVVNEDGYPTNPPFGRLNYPYQQIVAYSGTAINATSLNTLVEIFENSPLIPELISLQVDNPDTCPLTQTQPEPTPPPPPPPEKDCCRMGCCPKPTEINYQLIKRLMLESLKEQKFSVDVPIATCKFNEQKQEWEPKIEFTTLDFFATSKNQAEQMAQIHVENAKQAAELCVNRNKESEVYASVPDWWQTRSFQKSQLAIQYAENLGDGKLSRSRWCLHIPHYRYGESHKPSFPSYQKGNFMGVQVLSDNSKIIVWCSSKPECLRVINALKQYVDPNFLQGIEKPRVTESNSVLKKVSVVPVLCQFFPDGQKNTVPQWSKKLRAKK